MGGGASSALHSGEKIAPQSFKWAILAASGIFLTKSKVLWFWAWKICRISWYPSKFIKNAYFLFHRGLRFFFFLMSMMDIRCVQNIIWTHFEIYKGEILAVVFLIFMLWKEVCNGFDPPSLTRGVQALLLTPKSALSSFICFIDDKWHDRQMTYQIGDNMGV